MPINNVSATTASSANSSVSYQKLDENNDTKETTSVNIGGSKHEVSQDCNSSKMSKVFVSGLAVLSTLGGGLTGYALGSRSSAITDNPTSLTSTTHGLGINGNNVASDFVFNPCDFFIPKGFENKTEAVENLHMLGITTGHKLIFSNSELAFMKDKADAAIKNDHTMEHLGQFLANEGYEELAECPPYTKNEPSVLISNFTNTFRSAGDDHHIGRNMIIVNATESSEILQHLSSGRDLQLEDLDNTHFIKATYQNVTLIEKIQLDHSGINHFSGNETDSIAIEARVYIARNSNNQTELSFDGLDAANARIELIDYLDAEGEIGYHASDACLEPHNRLTVVEEGFWNRTKEFIGNITG